MTNTLSGTQIDTKLYITSLALYGAKAQSTENQYMNKLKLIPGHVFSLTRSLTSLSDNCCATLWHLNILYPFHCNYMQLKVLYLIAIITTYNIPDPDMWGGNRRCFFVETAESMFSEPPSDNIHFSVPRVNIMAQVILQH